MQINVNNFKNEVTVEPESMFYKYISNISPCQIDLRCTE